MLWLQRCSSAYHYCNVSFFAFLSPLTSLALLLWPLSLTPYFCPQNCCSLDVFCFSHHYLQTLETVVRKNPRSAVQSHLDHISHCVHAKGSARDPHWKRQPLWRGFGLAPVAGSGDTQAAHTGAGRGHLCQNRSLVVLQSQQATWPSGSLNEGGWDEGGMVNA